MICNYLKIAWRNIKKDRFGSFLNISGLSVSITFCVLLLTYIQKEQSYDQFHENVQQLYRLEETNLVPIQDSAKTAGFFSFLSKSDEVNNNLVFPLTVGMDLKKDLPDVKNIVRYKDQSDQLVKVETEVYRQSHVLYTDTNFFHFFSFHVINGNPNTVFSKPDQVVLSKKTALKYFGNSDPMGKTLTLMSDTGQRFVVSGIAEDAPENSSIQFDMILPVTADPGYKDDLNQHFNTASYFLLVELEKGVVPDEFRKKLTTWMKGYYLDYIKSLQVTDTKNYYWYLRPFADGHYNPSSGWGHYTNKNDMYQLGLLTMIILVMSALNYILLKIAGGSKRGLEVSVRKLFGARSKSIILLFWIETQLTITISIALGFVLSVLGLPLFNQMVSDQLSLQDFNWSSICINFLLIEIILGIMAGIYPAWLLSKQKLIDKLKGFSTYKFNPKLSNVLTTIQYTISATLITAVLTIKLQNNLIHSKDLGFDKNDIIIVKNPSTVPSFTHLLRKRLSEFSLSQPSIVAFSGMNGGLDGMNSLSGFQINGEKAFRRQLSVDFNYFEMLKLKMVAGRSFSKSFPSDTARGEKHVVVNETLLRLLGKDAKVGSYNTPLHATIIGVVKDYNFESLTNRIEPQEHQLLSDFEMNFMFKVKSYDLKTIIPKIENEWRQITNNYPFEYSFLDDSIEKMYVANMRWEKIIESSCLFAVCIACLGLFGLSAIQVNNRVKEMGIRKVLGASAISIFTELTRNIFLYIVLGIIISVPIGYFLARNWLNKFAYRIELDGWMFAGIALVVFLIALITLAIKTYKSVVENPTRSLRGD